jgi:hypothetical protein
VPLNGSRDGCCPYKGKMELLIQPSGRENIWNLRQKKTQPETEKIITDQI